MAATLSLYKTVFLFPQCMWEGVGWVKNPKIISDHFSSHFVQFGTTLIFFIWPIFLSPQLGEGGGDGSKNFKLFSDQIPRHFGLFGKSFIFFVPNLGVGGWVRISGNYCWSKFQPNWDNLDFFVLIFPVTNWKGGGAKFSHHFSQFGKTLIFLSTFCFSQIGGRGG